MEWHGDTTYRFIDYLLIPGSTPQLYQLGLASKMLLSNIYSFLSFTPVELRPHIQDARVSTCFGAFGGFGSFQGYPYPYRRSRGKVNILQQRSNLLINKTELFGKAARLHHGRSMAGL